MTILKQRGVNLVAGRQQSCSGDFATVIRAQLRRKVPGSLKSDPLDMQLELAESRGGTYGCE
jgi:hypothetical protein